MHNPVAFRLLICEDRRIVPYMTSAMVNVDVKCNPVLSALAPVAY